ncbi:hypothetical protein FUA26_01695 [Seonamhaeicola algicola]|uniref:Uncharacterized protein n=1 Tax=Seonamhaeicola algicola TaxID=1719036 RepID=A0A5C7B251_9FLAO|nr:hypothetical protein [Seonamhaeicola algicola]TXE13819.1 hypothetical protein FUA26_01695 [Seonamhaeicola algicola]
MGINRILEKYKLIKTFERELNVEKQVFISEFRQMTQKGYYSPLLIMLDIIKSENKKYIGDINSKSFKIRERFTLDNSFANNFATVKSEFQSKDNKLKVKTTIQGMEVIPFILRIMIFGIYSLLMFIAILEILLILFSSDAKHIDGSMIMGPIILTTLVGFLTYLPYRIAKKKC